MTSTLDPDNFPATGSPLPKGHSIRSLGPSDSSDSGSDVVAPQALDDEELAADTDRYGTGEHASAGNDKHLHVNSDIEPDRVIASDEAGLGGGLDQAEEAQLGITDEELEEDAGLEDEY